MIEHCKMSCGADSRKASNNPELSASRWIFFISFLFSGDEVSIRNKPKQNLKFLKSNNKIK